MYVYIYVHTYVHVYTHLYLHIYIKREKDRERRFGPGCPREVQDRPQKPGPRSPFCPDPRSPGRTQAPVQFGGWC